MSKIIEEMLEEAREEAKIMYSYEAALRLLKRGKLTFEEIADVVGLPLEDVRELAEENDLMPV